MYLGKMKASGHFTMEDVMSGKLLAGQMEILWFLAYAGFATPELLCKATNYRKSSVMRKYLQSMLTQFKLVKRINLDFSSVGFKAPTNAYVLTARGYKKLGVKERRFTREELLELPFSEHRKMVAELLAYFFRHDTSRYKAREETFVKSDGNWKSWLSEIKKEEVDKIRHKYGVGYTTNVAIKQFEEQIKSVPIPDLYCGFNVRYLPGLRLLENFGVERGAAIFMEVETGNNGVRHINTKLENYEKKKGFFDTYMDIKDYAVLFISSDEDKEKALKSRVQEAPVTKSTSYPILHTTVQELGELLVPSKHVKEPKW